MSELYANKLDTKEDRVNGIVLDAITTHRGTHVEMIQCPTWNIACYMDGIIQSCEMDEATYHESLVHPIMSNTTLKKRVLIIGGGEGATAREVLKWPVEQVDMYDWDEEVVQLFQNKYPQWAKGAWEDKRLTLHFDNIFDIISEEPSAPYDIIIIDLFDPSNDNILSWYDLFMKLDKWITKTGSIVVYTGIRNMLERDRPVDKIIGMFQYYDTWQGMKIKLIPMNMSTTPYHVYVPSFMGEATFLLLQPKTIEPNQLPFENSKITSHLTNEIWKSYQTWNW